MPHRPSIGELEVMYESMSELRLGSVRSPQEDLWFWKNEDTLCMYARNKNQPARILRVLTLCENGGATAERYLFDDTGILRFFGLELSEEEMQLPSVSDYIEDFNELDASLGMPAKITDTHRKKLWQTLLAPIVDYR